MENKQRVTTSSHQIPLIFSAKGFEEITALCTKGKHQTIAAMSRAAYAFYRWFLDESAKRTEILTYDPSGGSTHHVRFWSDGIVGLDSAEDYASDHPVMLTFSQEAFGRIQDMTQKGSHASIGHMTRAAYTLYAWYLDEVKRGREIVIRETDGSTTQVVFTPEEGVE